jgi:hypothetical protein
MALTPISSFLAVGAETNWVEAPRLQTNRPGPIADLD